jgi:C4-dicarboxylate transporter, DctM subunit
MSAVALIAILLACIVIGVPVGIALGIASIATLLLFVDQSLAVLAQRFFSATQVYPLLAIPFFILAGTLMATGGVAQRLIDFANALVGRFRGGLAMAALLGCAFFAAVSGSATATVVAIGTLMIAGMQQAGYSRDFSAGLICNAGTLGILIPPSIVMIVYGAVTETSVGQLFVAGVVPALLLTAALMAAVAVIARRNAFPRQRPADWRELLVTARRAFWGLLLIVIVLGGIYGGVFTPTEAAAVAAVYAFVVAVFAHRDVRVVEVPRILTESARTTAMLMLIIGNAYLFAFVLTTEQIPQQAADWIVGMGLAPWAFLLVLNLLLLLAGNFMEPTSVVLIVAPIVFPIAIELGIDPVHLGILMVLNMQIGLVTPPVGLNLFVTAGVSGLGAGAVIRAALPWLSVLLAVLLIVTYIPAVSLWLPGLLGWR